MIDGIQTVRIVAVQRRKHRKRRINKKWETCIEVQLKETATEELKPCPFCGEFPTLKHDLRYPQGYDDSIHASEVICENLDCPIYNADNTYYLTDEEAIEAWNRRAKNG